MKWDHSRMKKFGRESIRALLCTLILLSTATATAESRFEVLDVLPLHEPPGDDFNFTHSMVLGASADGCTLVGFSGAEMSSPTFVPVIWRNSEITELLFGNRISGMAQDVSADGRTIVGRGRIENGGEWNNAGLVWTDGQVDDAYHETVAIRVSSGGDVVVLAPDNTGPMMLGSEGTVTNVIDWEGASWITPFDMTPDASVVVASATWATPEGMPLWSKGFRWTDGFQKEMTPRPGDEAFIPVAVSADGTVIAGNVSASVALRWVDETYEEIGPFAVREMSADGSVVIGTAYDAEIRRNRAVIWRDGEGWQLLDEFATDTLGLDLNGWRTSSAFDITPDGRIIVGQANNYPGYDELPFALYLDDSGCIPDTDADGVADSADNCSEQVNVSQFDGDGDGYGDACDACVPTPVGQAVDAMGCSVSDLVPCAHPLGAGKWKNHGAYMSTLAHTANEFVAAGLISEVEKNALRAAGGSTDCGKK